MNQAIFHANSENNVWGFWASALLGAVIAVIWLATQIIVGVVIARTQGLTLPELENNGHALSVITIFSSIIALVVIAVFIRLRKNATLSAYLGLRLLRPRTLLQLLVIMVGFMIAQEILSIVLNREVIPKFMTEAIQSAQSLVLLWFAVIIAGPLAEEFFFRGFLLEGFRHSFLGNAGAVILTSLMWAVIHLQYPAYEIGVLFVLGIVLGSARIMTGSIWAPVSMHIFNNLVSTIMISHYLQTQAPAA
jgi:membrane protease YdiL (CAAX protease family)